MMQSTIQKSSDTVVGASLVAGGATGFTAQSLVEWGSLIVTLGNVILVIGGMYIMYVRLKQSRGKNRRKGD